MESKFSIAITDDNKINRATFLQKLELMPQAQLVFVAESGRQCLEKLKTMPHPNLPQVIFMDLEMPEMSGIETIRLAKSLYPQIHFIVLTIYDDEDKIFEAIKAGASGYLMKHEPAPVLLEAITNVLHFGGAPMSPAIARKTLNLLGRSAAIPHQAETPSLPEGLTGRELDVLQHMVNGWDAKRISSELGLSVLTVRKHIANLYEKLHINSKAQAISLAYKGKWFK